MSKLQVRSSKRLWHEDCFPSYWQCPSGTAFNAPALADPAENRQPECLREQMWYDSKILDVVKNGPAGVRIALQNEIGDPRYAGQGWEKWEITELDKQWSRANPNVSTVFKLQMHYLYNVQTGAIVQAKLKNSRQEGCTGKQVPVGQSANNAADGRERERDGSDGRGDPYANTQPYERERTITWSRTDPRPVETDRACIISGCR